MMVLLFKSQLRADIDGGESWATKARMMDLVSKVPGFISDKTYTSEAAIPWHS